MVKIAVGYFVQESHSFAPVRCSWEQFQAGYVLKGSEVIARFRNTRCEVAGAIDVAERNNIQIAPLIACNAVSCGALVQEVFEALMNEMLARLHTEMPVDGVFLGLHGAMLAERDDDPSATVLEAVRNLVGQGVPLVGTLDLHGNVTHRMVAAADVLVGYH